MVGPSASRRLSYTEAASQLLVPASVVPVAPQVGGLVGYHHHVKDPCRDGQPAAGAEVFLDGRVGLYRADGYPEKIAHTSSATIARKPMLIITMSPGFLSLSLKGLKPMGRTVNDLTSCLPSSQ